MFKNALEDAVKNGDEIAQAFLDQVTIAIIFLKYNPRLFLLLPSEYEFQIFFQISHLIFYEKIYFYNLFMRLFRQQSEALERMYVYFCNSRPAADEILNKPEIIEFWDVSIWTQTSPSESFTWLLSSIVFDVTVEISSNT